MGHSKFEGILRSRFPKTYERIKERERERRRIGPRTKEGKFYSKEKQEYTKEEYIEEVVDPAIEEHEETVESIDPFGTYKYKDQWGQDTFVSGETLLERYEKEGTITELKEHKEEVERLPSDAKFKRTDKGYEMIPASPLSWTRHYKKRASELPPVASEISRFGFGIFSSVGGFVKPVLDWAGVGKHFDMYSTVGVSSAVNPFDTKGTLEDVGTGLDKSRWGVHYVSPFDVAFEQVGFSPKGSTKELTSDPWFFAGGIAGELGVFAGTHYTFKGIGKGIRYGTKTVIRKAPEIYGKFTKVFPEEKLITESGRVIHTKATRKFISRFGHTRTWHTMSRWSTGNIVKVRSLPLKHSIPFKEGKLTSRLDVYKGWGQSRWVPKKVLDQAQKTETFHRHFYDPFGRYQTYVTEQLYKPKGHLWWKTAKKQITTWAEHESLYKVFDPADVWGGFVRPSSKYTFIGLMKDTRGTASLIHRPVHYRPMIRSGLHHAGHLTTGSMPITMSGSKPASLLGIGLISGLRTGSALASDTLLSYQSEFEPVRHQLKDVSKVSLQTPMSIQSVVNLTVPRSAQRQRTNLKHDIALEKTTRVKPITPIPYHVFSGNIRIFPMIFPESSKGRRKKRGFIDPLLSGYKFRLFKPTKFSYESPFTKKKKKKGLKITF